MEAINSTTTNDQRIPTVSQAGQGTGPVQQPKAESTTSEAPKSDFAALLSKSLGKNDQEMVNEEELYSSIIEQLLVKDKTEAAEAYKSAKETLKAQFTRPDGYTYLEELSRAALNEVVKLGKLTAEEGDLVNGQAFAAAQLDGNQEALYDSNGSENDPTKAIAKMSEAMFKIGDLTQLIESGEFTAGPRSLALPGNMLPKDISAVVEGFASSKETTTLPPTKSDTETDSADLAKSITWEPKSDVDGNALAVLPALLKELIERVELVDVNGKVLAEAAFEGATDADKRPIVRFSESGEFYGDELTLKILLTDGTTKTFTIDKGGEVTVGTISPTEETNDKEKSS